MSYCQTFFVEDNAFKLTRTIIFKHIFGADVYENGADGFILKQNLPKMTKSVRNSTSSYQSYNFHVIHSKSPILYRFVLVKIYLNCSEPIIYFCERTNSTWRAYIKSIYLVSIPTGFLNSSGRELIEISLYCSKWASISCPKVVPCIPRNSQPCWKWTNLETTNLRLSSILHWWCGLI